MNIFDAVQLHMPKVIDTVDSPLNGKIEVIHIGKTTKLVVEGVVQSMNWDSPACGRLYWGKTIEILKEQEPELKTIMILGMGGGTLAQLISREFPEAQITSVEFDQVMLDLAKEYFAVEKIPNHRIINADALKVVVDAHLFNISHSSFDVLMVDIYVGQTYPDLGKSGNFVTAIKRLVKPGGLIIFNRIYLEHHQHEVNVFINYVSQFLKDVKCLVVAGYTNSDNVLIYGRV